MVVLITGGSGFLGNAIVEAFLSDWKECEVRILDLQKPDADWLDKIQFYKGDVRDEGLVHNASQGVDIVIHSAAVIDWGTKTKQEVLDVNVGGTENVISACIENKIPYLVYTSSLDAIFRGQAMRNIDESVSYPPKPVNAYCESKQRSEELVLAANGEKLNTCVLRPSDIYGEGDPYHIGSLIEMAKKGFYVRLGNGKSVCQHVYVKNMAYAHLLAARALMKNDSVVKGQVYFITDGPGKNFFKFYDQVVKGVGYTIRPRNLWLPYWLAFAIASLTEAGAWLIRPIKKVNPKFSLFAVKYTCSDFTFSADKARKDFGYQPKYSEKEALDRTIRFYRLKKD